MKAFELRELDADELAEKLDEAKEELFNLRFQMATNQLDNTARLRQVRREVARVRLGKPRPATLVAARSLTLVQAAVKGSKLDGILRGATELGATGVVVAVASRSVKRPPDGRMVQRLGRIAVEAARQCGRGDAPAVIGPEPLAEALAAHAVAPDAGAALCLDPGANLPLAATLADVGEQTPIVLVIGPEGGLTADELDAAAHHGYQRVSLGRFVLRTETAALAALGAVASRG